MGIYKAAPIVFILFIFLILSMAQNVLSFEYKTYYTDSDGTNPAPPSFGFIGASNITVISKLYLPVNVSPSGTVAANFFSPFSSLSGAASGTFTYNSTCAFLGYIEKERTGFQYHEAKVTSTKTTVGSNNERLVNYFSGISTNRFINLTTTLNDSENYVINLFERAANTGDYATSLTDATVYGYFYNQYGENCYTTDSYGAINRRVMSGINAGGANCRVCGYVPFNATGGNVTINATNIYSNTGGSGGRVTVFKLSDASIPSSGSFSVASGALSFNRELSLNQNEYYVMGYCYDRGGCNPVNPPAINIMIDTAIPKYSCSDYSACANNYKSRTCTDTLGYYPQKIETASCSLTVLENATIGFENYEPTENIVKCVPDWLGIYGISYNNADWPQNWTISTPATYRPDYITMTQEWATEGTRSLKMWYIPPLENQPLDNTTCGNLTAGIIPSVYRRVGNDSFKVSYNVTFPAENMQLSYDVRACIEQTRQHYGLESFLGFIKIPEQCYAGNCSRLPRARYSFNIIDYNTSASIFGNPFFDEAPAGAAYIIDGKTKQITRSITRTIDLRNSGIVANKEYNIIFAVYPENLYDNTGDCVMLDNVRYEKTQEPLTVICESTCEGTTYREATKLSGGQCVLKLIENSEKCFSSSSVQNAISSLSDYCDGTDYYDFNDKTGKYEKLANADYCNETAETEIAELTDIATSEQLNDLFNLTLSLFFILSIAILAVGVFVTKYTDSRMGITVMVALMVIFSVAGLYPWLVTGVVLFILIIIAAREITGIMTPSAR